MSRVVILGAGISGHTAAAFARKWLGKNDTVTVVSPGETYNWIPSNILVGVGRGGRGPDGTGPGDLPARARLRAPRDRVQAGLGLGDSPRRRRREPGALRRYRDRRGSQREGALRLPGQRHRAAAAF